MTPTQLTKHDKDVIQLNEIDVICDISQRELSHKTGLSQGSVNLLIQKIICEGLLKMKIIPINWSNYILTPKGLEEKKVRYVKRYYNAIHKTKQLIRWKLDLHFATYDTIILC